MSMIAVGMTALAVVVAALMVVLVSRAGRGVAIAAAIVIAVLMVAEYALASSGILREWTRRPPPFMPAVAVPILLALVVALSPLGRRIAAAASFALIIGIQGFRLPLELVMHDAATTGLMPVQMTYTGWNFDIATGTLAIAVAWVAARSPRSRGIVFAWNLLGTLLLINIVTIAIVSLPMFAAFGPDRVNTWVAEPPYVFLPTVLVPAAVFGHALTWRKLAASGIG
ncbi:MAG: hypothetical protein DMF88_25635 [Acidobacteria bacterium]|nr:MAG: hypothetical protein DMF88_25635 [Acidobacteriota bacterium]